MDRRSFLNSFSSTLAVFGVESAIPGTRSVPHVTFLVPAGYRGLLYIERDPPEEMVKFESFLAMVEPAEVDRPMGFVVPEGVTVRLRLRTPVIYRRNMEPRHYPRPMAVRLLEDRTFWTREGHPIEISADGRTKALPNTHWKT